MTGSGDRSAGGGRGADRGVVDDPVDHHGHGLRRHRHRVGGNLGDLVRQVLADRKVVGAAVRPDLVDQATDALLLGLFDRRAVEQRQLPERPADAQQQRAEQPVPPVVEVVAE